MFQESWIRLGIMPPLGGTFLLPRLVGLGRAMEMCLRGKQVRAEEALAIGLVGEVVARDDLEARGLELARALAASDRKSVVEGKSVSVRVDLGGRRSIKKKKN